MNKRQFAIPCLLAFALGCSDTSDRSSNANVQTTTAMPAEQPCPKPVTSGYTYLPDGVVFSFKHHVRADRIVSNRAGGSHRRVIIETLNGAASELAKSALADAGFNYLDSKEVPNDGIRMRFNNGGGGPVVVTIYSEPGVASNAPSAIEVLVVEFSETAAEDPSAFAN